MPWAFAFCASLPWTSPLLVMLVSQLSVAAAVRLPGVTLDKGKWQRLLESNAMDDFEPMLRDRISDVVAIAQASFAELRGGDFRTQQTLEDFTVNNQCHHVIKAKEPNATASIGVDVRHTQELPILLDDEIENGTVGSVYEVEADVSLLLQTNLSAYAIFKKGLQLPWMQDCWYYGEKAVHFTVKYHDRVELTFNLHLSEPRAEEVGGNGGQVVFSLNASLNRDANNAQLGPVMLEVKTEESGKYGCVVRTFYVDLIGTFFPVCTRMDNYLRDNTDTLVSEGVPNISKKVLEQLENGTRNAIGSSVVIPIRIAGPAPSRQ